MIVVADSGPLHYLILLEHTELLRRFYGQVVVPEPVASELSAAGPEPPNPRTPSPEPRAPTAPPSRHPRRHRVAYGSTNMYSPVKSSKASGGSGE